MNRYLIRAIACLLVPAIVTGEPALASGVADSWRAAAQSAGLVDRASSLQACFNQEALASTFLFVPSLLNRLRRSHEYQTIGREAPDRQGPRRTFFQGPWAQRLLVSLSALGLTSLIPSLASAHQLVVDNSGRIWDTFGNGNTPGGAFEAIRLAARQAAPEWYKKSRLDDGFWTAFHRWYKGPLHPKAGYRHLIHGATRIPKEVLEAIRGHSTASPVVPQPAASVAAAVSPTPSSLAPTHAPALSVSPTATLPPAATPTSALISTHAPAPAAVRTLPPPGPHHLWSNLIGWVQIHPGETIVIAVAAGIVMSAAGILIGRWYQKRKMMREGARLQIDNKSLETLARVTRELDETRRNLAAARARVPALDAEAEARIQAASEQIENLKTQLADARSKAERHSLAVQQGEEQARTLQERIAGLERKLESSEGDVQKMREDLARAQASLAELANAREPGAQQAEQSQNRIHQLEQDLAEARQQAGELWQAWERKCASWQEEIGQLSKRLEATEVSLADARASNSSKVQYLGGALSAAEDRADALRHQIMELQEALAEARSELGASKRGREQLLRQGEQTEIAFATERQELIAGRDAAVAERKQLQEEFEALRGKFEAALTAVTRAQEDAQAEAAQLRQDLGEALAAGERLANDLADAERRHGSELKNARVEAEGLLSRQAREHRQQVDGLRAERDTLTAQLEAEGDTLATAQMELEAAGRRITELEHLRDQLREQVESGTGELKEAIEEKLLLTRQLEDGKQEIAALDASVHERANELDTMAGDLDRARLELHSKDESLAVAGDQAGQLRARAESLQRRLIAAQEQDDRSQQEVVRLTGELQAYGQRITELRAQAAQQAQDYQHQVATLQTDRDALAADLEAERAGLAGLQQQLQDAQSALGAQEEENQALQRDLSAAHVTRDAANANLSRLTEEVANLRSEVAALCSNRRLHEAERGLREARIKIEEQARILKGQRNQAADLETLRGSLAAAQSEREQLKETINQLGGTVDQLRAEISRLQGQIATLQSNPSGPETPNPGPERGNPRKEENGGQPSGESSNPIEENGERVQLLLPQQIECPIYESDLLGLRPSQKKTTSDRAMAITVPVHLFESDLRLSIWERFGFKARRIKERLGAMAVQLNASKTPNDFVDARIKFFEDWNDFSPREQVLFADQFGKIIDIMREKPVRMAVLGLTGWDNGVATFESQDVRSLREIVQTYGDQFKVHSNNMKKLAIVLSDLESALEPFQPFSSKISLQNRGALMSAIRLRAEIILRIAMLGQLENIEKREGLHAGELFFKSWQYLADQEYRLHLWDLAALQEQLADHRAVLVAGLSDREKYPWGGVRNPSASKAFETFLTNTLEAQINKLLSNGVNGSTRAPGNSHKSKTTILYGWLGAALYSALMASLGSYYQSSGLMSLAFDLFLGWTVMFGWQYLALWRIGKDVMATREGAAIHVAPELTPLMQEWAWRHEAWVHVLRGGALNDFLLASVLDPAGLAAALVHSLNFKKNVRRTASLFNSAA